MDTLEIIKKLKKKRPDLAHDPLFSELEMAQMDEGEGEDGLMDAEAPMSGMPGKPEEGSELSYLDAPEDEQAEGEAGADNLMEELNEEGTPDEGDDSSYAASYLDEDEEGNPVPRSPRKKQRPSRVLPQERGV